LLPLPDRRGRSYPLRGRGPPGAPGGRLFLRACLFSAGERNEIDERILRETFAAWRCLLLREADIPSDTRAISALVALFESPIEP
jgi:hypothetical protein